jgi:replicative DNA helicase
MDGRTESVILSGLIKNEVFARKVLPFIKTSYFSEIGDRLLFEKVEGFYQKYNKSPSLEALVIDTKNDNSITEKPFAAVMELMDVIKTTDEHTTDTQWLLDNTEKFCQDKALYNGIMESIAIFEGKGEKSKASIPELLNDALGVTFDTSVGHDFIDDASSRFDYYNRKEARIPFDIDLLNTITAGGLPKGTLNVLIAGVNVGKTFFMCHCASAALLAGKNVLYITMEMAEEEIAKRIDANTMDVDINLLPDIPKSTFMRKVDTIRQKTMGKLIIKQFPTGGASAANFRVLIDELRIKREFIPDIVFIDYLGICASTKLKMSGSINTYTYVKAIAEELRALAVERELPIMTAAQVNRSGQSSTDVEMENVAESHGLSATADSMFAIMAPEELVNLGQLMVKQIKNRYTDKNKNKRFVVGADYNKMRLYNVSQNEQFDDDKPVMDKGDFSDGMEDEISSKFRSKKPRDFGSFNF